MSGAPDTRRHSPATILSFRRRVVRIGLLTVALGVTAAFIALGVWQLDRAAQKRAVLADFESRGNAPSLDLNQTALDGAAAAAGYRAAAAGRYLNATILLDNQLHRGRAGYQVYTALALDGRNESVLVNRGWIGMQADRRRAPEFVTPVISQQLHGRLSQPPQAGLRLKHSDMIELLADGMWRVQAIDFGALTATLGMKFLPITVLLDSDAPHGFVRAWKLPGSDEARHLGYAFQWFALALTVMVVTVVVALRKGPSGDV